MKNSYYTYMLTNQNKTVIYVGMTNNLDVRILEHYKAAIQNKKHFTSRYNCYFCVWYEAFETPREAIDKEDALKRLSRKGKENIIDRFNPEWKLLNQDILKKWPPDDWMLDWMARDDEE